MKTNDKKAYLGITFSGIKKEGTRLGLAVGKIAGINGQQNDFDDLPIYKEIVPMVNKDGEKAIRIPSFYLKHTVTKNGRETWCISKNKIDSGYEKVSSFLFGAYEASVQFGMFYSLSGQKVANRIPVNDAFEIIKKRDDAFFTPMYQRGIIAILMAIEFGTRDLQTVFKGLTDNYYRDIENIPTGECDNLKGSSNTSNNVIDGCASFSYRGIENLYGRYWEVLTDGIIDNDGIHVLNQKGKEVVLKNFKFCGWPKRMAIIKGLPGVLIGTGKNVGYDNGYSDYQDFNNYGTKCFMLGGGPCVNGGFDGPFFFCCFNGWTDSYWYFGFRLSYREVQGETSLWRKA